MMTRRFFLGASATVGVAAALGRTFFDLGSSWRKSEMGLWIPVYDKAHGESITVVREVFFEAGQLRIQKVPWVSGGVTLVEVATSKNISAVVPLEQARALWRGGAGWRVQG